MNNNSIKCTNKCKCRRLENILMLQSNVTYINKSVLICLCIYSPITYYYYEFYTKVVRDIGIWGHDYSGIDNI